MASSVFTLFSLLMYLNIHLVKPAELNSHSNYLDSFLHHYEITATHHLHRLTSGDHKDSITTIVLHAFGKDLSLLVHPMNTPKTRIKLYGKHGLLDHVEERFHWHSSLFVGRVLGDSLSKVQGFQIDQGFSWIIESPSDTIYVEPASRYFTNDSTVVYSSVVYKSSDIFLNCSSNQHTSPLCQKKRNDFLMLKGRKHFGWNSEHTGPIKMQRPQKKTEYQKSKYRCEVELVADHTFVAQMKYHVRDVVTMLFFLGKRADLVFREADFDQDGFPDGVRIIVSQISVYYDEHMPGYPMENTNDAAEFIRSFSRRIQKYCLSVCLCHRPFEGDVVGLAYRANPDNLNSIGGICQSPVLFHNGERLSTNTAIVSTYGDIGVLPLFVISNSFTHELGHSFGSEHDSSEDLECSPGGAMGNFLMTPFTIDGSKLHHNMFSPCSKKAIQSAMQQRGKCLKRKASPYCGNGIREEGEDCDCGTRFTCSYIDPCCAPKGGSGTDSECTFLKHLNFECSFVESPCCSPSCRIVKASKQKPCSRDGSSTCRDNVCNGMSAECPTGGFLRDGTSCYGTHRTCNHGSCNSSVCLDNGMPECFCSSSDECHVCCFDSLMNKCLPAKNLLLFTEDGGHFVRPQGTACQNTGTCNRLGECIEQSEKKNLRMVNIILQHWPYFFFSFVLIALTVLLIYFIRKSRSLMQKNLKVFITPPTAPLPNVTQANLQARMYPPGTCLSQIPVPPQQFGF